MKHAQRVCVKRALCLLGCCLFCALAVAAALVWPEATGESQKKSRSLVVDASNSADGYIMVKARPSKKKLKLRISLGDTTLTYDLNGDGEYEVFPLQLGSGTYQIILYQNASGQRYSQDGKVRLKVSLNDENAAFLCPSQYVNYTQDSPAVQTSFALCDGLATDRERFEAVRSYIRSSYVYVYVKADTVKVGTLPDIDSCISKQMGICQDLAALAACMLRVQGIPTKLVVGYAGNSYHAWNSVLIDGEEILYDPTMELNALAKNQTYTVERFY